MTVVVDYRGSGTYADNVELIAEDSADLTVVFLHNWNDDAVHVSAHHTVLGDSAKLRHNVITLGGDLVRVSPTLIFQAPEADGELNACALPNRGSTLSTARSQTMPPQVR